MTGIFQLKGQVKQYDWGGDSFLPQLLGIDNPQHLPFAEYWMGIHPQGPSRIESVDKHSTYLSEKEPHFSFLLKILDVREMLSIQVHPNREMAQLYFERENRLGIPLNSPERNYKDPNHKPELMVALSEFWLLHGFKSPEALKETFAKYPELNPLQAKWEEMGNRGVYQWLMELPQLEVDAWLSVSANNWGTAYEQGALSKSDPAFWAARAVKSFCKNGKMDRGIFSIFLFNVVKLEKGQGIFQGAGIPHAYLAGQNVEIMANSDNVLRGGLTNKYMDVCELMRHIDTSSIEPRILEPKADGVGLRHYPAPVDDFRIQSILLEAGQEFQYQAQESLLILAPAGDLEITDGGASFHLGSPDLCAYVAANTSFTVRPRTRSLLFIASGHNRSAD